MPYLSYAWGPQIGMLIESVAGLIDALPWMLAGWLVSRAAVKALTKEKNER